MKSANFHPGYIGLPVLCFLFFTACLKFGKDIELSGDAFDPATLAKVATLTGLRFPAGARGVEYLYCGSGIDDSLAAKIEIPDEGVDEFMNNPVFSAGIDAKPSIQIGRGKQWWKIEQLARRVDRTQDLPVTRNLEVSCGREGTQFVVYISWMTS